MFETTLLVGDLSWHFAPPTISYQIFRWSGISALGPPGPLYGTHAFRGHWNLPHGQFPMRKASWIGQGSREIKRCGSETHRSYIDQAGQGRAIICPITVRVRSKPGPYGGRDIHFGPRIRGERGDSGNQFNPNIQCRATRMRVPGNKLYENETGMACEIRSGVVETPDYLRGTVPPSLTKCRVG